MKFRCRTAADRVLQPEIPLPRVAPFSEQIIDITAFFDVESAFVGAAEDFFPAVREAD